MHWGLPSWGIASLGLFRTLVRVLDQFKRVYLCISGVGLVRWHQLVGTISKIGSFYMNARINFIRT